MITDGIKNEGGGGREILKSGSWSGGWGTCNFYGKWVGLRKACRLKFLTRYAFPVMVESLSHDKLHLVSLLACLHVLWRCLLIFHWFNAQGFCSASVDQLVNMVYDKEWSYLPSWLQTFDRVFACEVKFGDILLVLSALVW